ncbi:hypothetical protein GCM10023310_12370 [Paenibacillus vulneris]
MTLYLNLSEFRSKIEHSLNKPTILCYTDIKKTLTKEMEVTIMTTKTASVSGVRQNVKDVQRLVNWMTAAAWGILGIGLVLCLFNLHHFSDRNTSLMVGVGFLVGSVHIYVIRTAIHLVHSRMLDDENDKIQQ